MEGCIASARIRVVNISDVLGFSEFVDEFDHGLDIPFLGGADQLLVVAHLDGPELLPESAQLLLQRDRVKLPVCLLLEVRPLIIDQDVIIDFFECLNDILIDIVNVKHVNSPDRNIIFIRILNLLPV